MAPELSVTVLGSCGGYAGPGGACSGYLVRQGDTALLLDAGPGTLANLQRHVVLSAISGIVLSHEHPDHWADIEGLSVASTYYLGLPPIPVFAPAGLSDHVQMPLSAYAWSEVADGAVAEVGGLGLTFSRTDHGPTTLAVRIDGDARSVGYSADTGPQWSLEALGPRLDLALCEATYLRDHEGSARHMSARQAGITGRDAGVGQLVITHLAPTTDRAAAAAEAAEAFGGPVEVAIEHAVFVA